MQSHSIEASSLRCGSRSLPFLSLCTSDLCVWLTCAFGRLAVAIKRERLKRAGPGLEMEKRDSEEVSATAAPSYFRGRFRLTGKVYIGGSAIVKMAHNDRTDKSLALKIHSNQVCSGPSCRPSAH